MKKICISLVSTALSLFIVSYLVQGMEISSIPALIMLTLALSVLNITIKPILKLLSIPITILSLGLFSLVINGVVLQVAFMLVSGASFTGSFLAVIIASIWLSIINTVINKVLK